MVLGFTTEELEKYGGTDEKVKRLKKWLPEEKLPPLTSEQILLFLIKEEEDVERAKAAIKISYHCKRSLPKVFNKRKLDQSFYDVFQVCCMPEKTEDGCVIIYVSLIDGDYRKFNLDEFFKGLFMVFEAEVYHQPINGIKLIVNMENGGMWHFAKLKFFTLKTSVEYFQSGTPVAIKEIHCLNTNFFFEKILVLVRPFADKVFLSKVSQTWDELG
ncbi:alpha-tocopherol transfer protein-like [Photinus pyralis]|uniref:alpha-tocopherol transfer protein-like n=1 Tax=Photinus pyralis TaxID=7054 RepID=UPI0012671D7E|nr:alpha-tocopherol transfer protein-like [Photinus pyralis]